MIHDGVRPLIDPGLIEKVVAAGQTDRAMITAMPAKETIKESDAVAGAPRREDLVLAGQVGQPPPGIQPGDQLPTVRHLAAELRVNFNTIARAYRLLDDAGVISTQQGRGTYILEQPSEEVSERLRQEALEGLTRRYLAQAARLNYPADEVAKIFQKHLDLWIMGHPPPSSDMDN